MGFFTDLKVDLSQAVNELVDEQEIVKEDTVLEKEEGNIAKAEPIVAKPEPIVETKEIKMEKKEVVNNITTVPKTVPTKVQEAVKVQEIVPEKVQEKVQEIVPEIIPEKVPEKVHERVSPLTSVRRVAETVAPKEKYTIKKSEEKKMINENLEETALITKGMSIVGDINSRGSVDILGEVVGNVTALGKLNITGVIQGDSKASEIFVDSAQITGEIASEGTIKVGANSVIIGNISATCAVIAGAIKGDIDVKGPVVLDASAIVMGNIKSKSVQINSGAVIEGMCSQCYADISPTSFFSDIKKSK